MTMPIRSVEKWGLYVRVSTPHQAEAGFSLSDQRERLEAYAEERGWTWEIYEDPGLSGEGIEGRPAILRLLKDAKAGQIDGVLVVDETRLARDEFVAATIRQHLKMARVKVATPSRGEYDLSNPTDSLMAQVLGAFSAFDQDLRTEKMKDGRRRAVEEGYWAGGPPPFGYRVVDRGKHRALEIDENQSAMIRLVFDLIVNQGHSTYSATTYLNARGYRTSRGKLWRGPNLCYRLRQRYLVGQWTYHTDGEEICVTIPSIFTEEEWNSLQASIKGGPRTQRANRLYPLTGRDRCHLRCICGGNYFGKIDSSKRGRSYYECSHNHHSFGESRCQLSPRIVQSAKVDVAVWTSIQAVLTDEQLLHSYARVYMENLGNVASGQSELGNLEQQLGRLNAERTTLVRPWRRAETLATRY